MTLSGIEILGWVGSTLFSMCGAPQAWHSWRHKNSDGLTWAFLLMWLGGEIATLAYVSTKKDVLPLLVNYWLNLALLLVIIWYKAYPTRKIA